MELIFPSNALIIMVGASGSGKTTFAKKHFGAENVVSSDECRKMVSNDETNQEVNQETFDLFHKWIEMRMRLGMLTVADATNLRKFAREHLSILAGQYGRPAYVIRLDASFTTCLEQNAMRDRKVPNDVLHRHFNQFVSAIGEIDQEQRKGWYAAVHHVLAGEDVTVRIEP